MSFYLYQIAYSADAVKAMVAKPQDRAAAAEALALAGKATGAYRAPMAS